MLNHTVNVNWCCFQVKKVTATLDLRGEVCPLPELKSRRMIRKMRSGEVLKIIIDYSMSADRIPRIMKSYGHEVLSVKKIENAVWEILVRSK
ncbi:MAG: sulfurtransferase TusA family protein [Candidatus Heimdallarchaeota archaeon]|nr:MAG: sulfurtransferase TusA family protein [Candidatus Heimdallarchaeota archaeon]